MVYLVQYDLIRLEKDYDAIISEIQKSPDWAKLLKSAWAVKTNESVDKLYERLAAKTDGNDRLVIFQLQKDFAWWAKNLPQKVIDWIKAARQAA
jgi:hypothetical protein